jgi:hypothetical protein
MTDNRCGETQPGANFPRIEYVSVLYFIRGIATPSVGKTP